MEEPLEDTLLGPFASREITEMHGAAPMQPVLMRILLVSIVGLFALPAYGETWVWATGRVLAEDGKTPVANALVAAYDRKNRVIDYVRTGPDGDYALAVPASALNIANPNGGFLYQVSRFAGEVGRFATQPIRSGMRALGASATTDPILRIGAGAVGGLAGEAIASVLPGEKKPKHPVDPRTLPGAIVIKVAAPGRVDAVRVARVYWMQREEYRLGGVDRTALVAWLDPARLAPLSSEKQSEIGSQYLTFTEARIEPGIVERGQTVTIRVRMPLPPEPRTPVVVIARNARTGTIIQLHPIGEERFEGSFLVDKKTPRDDQTWCVVAYAEQDSRPGRQKAAEDAIIRAGLLDPKKPYIYNPLLTVSRNRADLTVTVVEPPKPR